MTATAQLADKNYRLFRSFSRKEIERKCFDCEKLTYYGRICNGVCTKEGEQH